MFSKTGLLGLACLVCLGPFAMADTMAVVSMPEVAAVPGATIDVPVTIAPADDLYSYDMMVNYDPSLLELTNLEAGSLIPSNWWFFSSMNTAGTAYALAFSPMGTPLPSGTGTGDILDLTFTVPQTAPPNAVATITVSRDPTTSPPLNDGAITMDASAGLVEVVPEPTTLALSAGGRAGRGFGVGAVPPPCGVKPAREPK